MTPVVSRRAALAGLGGILALGATRTAHAADLDQLHVSTVPIFDVAPLYAAMANGDFAAQSIDITTLPTQGGAVGIPGLVAGSIDICYSNTISVITAVERGIDLRILAAGSPIEPEPPDPAGLLKRKGDPYRTGKDFEGKTIGINTRRDIQWLVVRGWIKATGGDPDKVDYREVPIPAAIDALSSKRVDAALVVDPFRTVALDRGEFEVVAWPFHTVLPAMRPALWVVTAETAERKAALVTRYVKAYRKGVQWVNGNSHTDAYTKLVSGYTKLDPELIKKVHIPPELKLPDLGPIHMVSEEMRANGLLSKEVDLEAKVFKVS